MKVILVIDMQTKLLNVMSDKENLLSETKKLLKGAKLLEIPIIFSEQSPDKLGNTDELFTEFVDIKPIPKTSFSCMGEPILKEILNKFDEILIVGVETHICVWQSAKDLIRANKKVFLIPSCTSSRDVSNKNLYIENLRKIGVEIVSVEGFLFEIIQDAKNSHFKDISKIIK